MPDATLTLRLKSNIGLPPDDPRDRTIRNCRLTHWKGWGNPPEVFDIGDLAPGASSLKLLIHYMTWVPFAEDSFAISFECFGLGWWRGTGYEGNEFFTYTLKYFDADREFTWRIELLRPGTTGTGLRASD